MSAKALSRSSDCKICELFGDQHISPEQLIGKIGKEITSTTYLQFCQLEAFHRLCHANNPKDANPKIPPPAHTGSAVDPPLNGLYLSKLKDMILAAYLLTGIIYRYAHFRSCKILPKRYRMMNQPNLYWILTFKRCFLN